MEPNLDWIEGANAALQRAALRAREVAIQTNTSIHIMRDGKIIKLTAADLLREREEAAAALRLREDSLDR